MMRRIYWLPLAAVLCFFPLSIEAQTFTWTDPTGGSYDSVLDWNPIGVPDVPGEAARFNLPNTYTISIDTNNDTVSNFEVFDGDVTLISANINKTYNVQNLTNVLGGNLTLDRVSGRLDFNTSSLTIGQESALSVLDSNLLGVTGFLRVGDSSTNSFGQLTIDDQADLALGSSAEVFIGDNTFDSDGTSTLLYTGSGTTGSGGVSIVIGSIGPGELHVRDNASVTAYGGSLSMTNFSGRLLVDGGATYSLEDKVNGFDGVSDFFSGEIEVLTGGRFEAGFMDRSGGTTTINGAGSILRALNFDVDSSAQINVTGGGTLELETFGSEFISDGSDLTVTGAGSAIRGIAEVFLGGNNATFTLSGGATWEPLDPNLPFGLSASAAPNQTSAVTITGAGTTMNNNDSRLSFSEGTDSYSTGEISNGAVVTTERLTIGDGSGSARRWVAHCRHGHGPRSIEEQHHGHHQRSGRRVGLAAPIVVVAHQERGRARRRGHDRALWWRVAHAPF